MSVIVIVIKTSLFSFGDPKWSDKKLLDIPRFQNPEIMWHNVSKLVALWLLFIVAIKEISQK